MLSEPSPPIVPSPGAAAAKRKNRRTLRKRIVRNMNHLSILNIVMFSCVLLLFVVGILRPISYSVSDYFGRALAEDLMSPMAMHYFGVDSITELDVADPEIDRWIRSQIGEVTEWEQFAWSYNFDIHEGELSGEPVPQDAVYVRFVLHDDVVYSNVPAMASMEEGVIRHLIEYYKIETVHVLADEAGNPIGSVTVGINPMLPVALTLVLIVFVIALFLAATLLTKLISRLLTVPLIAPITQLEQKVRAIAEGDFESTKDAKIVLKRPLREIESLMDSTNRIMENMQRYAEQLEQQKKTVEEQFDELEAQNDELQRSKRQLLDAQKLLTERERSVRNLLDNAKQGFLTFGPDLTVDPEYSLECVRLFGGQIGGRSFAELIGCGDEEQRRFVERLLGRLFEERDSARRQVLLPLLPEEACLGDTFVHIEYAIISDAASADGAVDGAVNGGEPGRASERCMVILTDITEKRHLESRMEQERNTLQMVVKVVVDYNVYSSLVRSFTEWLAHPFPTDAPASRVKPALLDLFRIVHTFKGSFAQIGMSRMAERLHQAESLISAWHKASEPPAAAEVLERLRSLGMEGWLREEQDVLRSVLGESFFDQDHVLLVDRTKIVELERKMLSTLSPSDCQLLLPELRKIRYKPFKELLSSYPDYVLGLAERMDKIVEPFDIEGGDFLADGDTYVSLSRSLVHAFRNAVDHGLEGPDERAAAGKPEAGRIRCAVSLDGDTIVIDIRDDGRGIDVEALKRRAAEQGLLNEAERERMTHEEALQLAFLGELSSKDEVTELSGRGVGLSSLRYEAEKLGGRVTVSSAPGEGAAFRICLPYEPLNRLPAVTPEALLSPIAETAAGFFSDATALDFAEKRDILAEFGGKMALQNYSTFMSVKGACNGLFVLSMSETTAAAVTRSLAYGELTPEETELYMEDTLAEAANIVLGNSLQKMDALQTYLSIDPPVTVFTEGASMKVAEAEMWSTAIAGRDGEIRIGFIKM